MSFVLLLAIFALLGALFGWVSLLRLSGMQRELRELRAQLRTLELRHRSDSAPVPREQPATEPELPQAAPAPAPRVKRETPAVADPSWGAPASEPIPRTPSAARTSRAAQASAPAWYQHLREHWMSWLGGVCVGLAGIFLVRYSIEQGFLSPALRVAAGLVAGSVLHGAACWLRLRRGADPALAALAAGGSITLFASVLAALHLYQLFTPVLSFSVLALVAVATMWLALLHGPVLALLGILGAYAVPALVGGEGGNADTVLAYALVIGAAALALLRFVDRTWLWGGVFAGTAAWWLLTLGASEADSVRGWYLAAFLLLAYAIPARGWLLRSNVDAGVRGLARFWTSPPGAERMQASAGAGTLIAWMVSAIAQGFDSVAFVLWTPLPLLVLYLAGRRPHLVALAWLTLAATLGAWLVTTPRMTAGTAGLESFYWYCAGTTLVFVLLALRNARISEWQAWLPMSLFAPPAFLVLAWLKTRDAELSLQWSLLAATLGAVYLVLALQATRRHWPPLATAWLFLATHVAYSLAVAMYLREASLTLALAAQIVSLAWLIRRFELPALGWLLKGVVMLVVCRLTLNPFLLQYPADVHWSLWTYGGATLCCWLGSRRLATQPALRAWTEGAAWHLLVLALYAELRWWLYDGDVFAAEYTALEAGINASFFAALGLMYHWRRQFSAHLAPLLALYAKVLLCAGLFNYGVILLATRGSLAWITGEVATRPVFNSMLLFYALPVAMGWAVARYYLPVVRPLALIFTAGAAFVWVNLEIRHLWTGSISLQGSMRDGELYTYSAVWLVLAVAMMLAGAWRFGRLFYRAGVLTLLCVVAKLFLVDMADLQGLLRVASFLGMGLTLLAVAYLHRRLQPDSQAPSSSISTGI